MSWVLVDSEVVNGWQSSLLSSRTLIRHLFSAPGVNLSLISGPERDQSSACRMRLCRAAGLNEQALTVSQQVHGAEIVVVDQNLIQPSRRPPRIQSAGAEPLHQEHSGYCVPHVDGLMTDLPGVPLMGLSADCPLVLLVDPVRKAVGLVHAGWRGTVAGISARLVKRMHTCYGSDPKDLYGAISPSAGPCCYEVRDDVLRVAQTRWADPNRYFPRRDGIMTLDLWTANFDQLQSQGLSAEQIDPPGLCTICDRRFNSYRRLGASTGHSALVAGLGLEGPMALCRTT